VLLRLLLGLLLRLRLGGLPQSDASRLERFVQHRLKGLQVHGGVLYNHKVQRFSPMTRPQL
jgi:hypothetical protein